jgi:hypothetical protein
MHRESRYLFLSSEHSSRTIVVNLTIRRSIQFNSIQFTIMSSSTSYHPKQSDLRRRKAVADAMAGLVGSLVALWTFYPLDVIKTHLQADISLPSGRQLYRGVGSKTLHCASSSFVYFYLYSYITTWWTQRRSSGTKKSGDKLSTVARLALSAIAAMLNTAITLPLDVISSQHQTSSSSSSVREDDNTNKITNKEQRLGTVVDEEGDDAAAVAVAVADDDDDDENASEFFDTEQETDEEEKNNDEDGEQPDSSIIPSPPQTSSSSNNTTLSSLWKGLVPSLLLCTNPSIHYTVFDLLKSNLLEGRTKQNLTLSEAFVMGLIAKLTATLLTYPLIRAKVLLMVMSNNSNNNSSSLLGSLIREYKQNGIRGLYRGCNLQLAHTILKSALLMMVRERITATTLKLMLLKNEDV